jgi:hypothetical protein
MELQNEQELENTRAKLRELKELYEDARRDRSGNKEVRQVELESLMGLINQLKEEIIRFECRHGLPRTSVRD